MSNQPKSDAVELFPTRIRDRVVPAEGLAEVVTQLTGVGGGWDPQKDKAYIPVANTAHARVIRMHEATHAIFSKLEKGKELDVIDQALEDVRVHRIWLEDITGHPKRDEKVFALNSLRKVLRVIKRAMSSPTYLREGKPLDPTLRMGMALILTRSASILQKHPARPQANRLLARCCALLGVNTDEYMANCIHAVYVNDMAKARVEFSKYAFEPPPPKPKAPKPPPMPGGSKAGSGSGTSSGTGSGSPKSTSSGGGGGMSLPFGPPPMPKEMQPNPEYNDFSKPQGGSNESKDNGNQPQSTGEASSGDVPKLPKSDKGMGGPDPSRMESLPAGGQGSEKPDKASPVAPTNNAADNSTDSDSGECSERKPKSTPASNSETSKPELGDQKSSEGKKQDGGETAGDLGSTGEKKEVPVAFIKPAEEADPEPTQEEIKVKVAIIKQSDLNTILDKIMPIDEEKEREELERLSHIDSEDSAVLLVIPDMPPGKGKPAPMYIHHLNLQVPRRVSGRGGTDYNPTNSGMRIRAARLTGAMTNPNTKLFERRNVGGTVLIDASGSMGLDDAALMAIAESIPLGRVAYYSGTRDFDGTDDYGDLVVYAHAGKIRSKQDKLPFRHGGNLVDYAAVQWLLKQPAPRYLVSDGQFTGCTSRRGKDLVEVSLKQQKLKIVNNLRDLKLAMKGKKAYTPELEYDEY